MPASKRKPDKKPDLAIIKRGGKRYIFYKGKEYEIVNKKARSDSILESLDLILRKFSRRKNRIAKEFKRKGIGNMKNVLKFFKI